MNTTAGPTPSDQCQPQQGRCARLLSRWRRSRRPSNRESSTITGKRPVSFRKLQINLSGTRLAADESTTAIKSQSGTARRLNIQRCEIIGLPVSYQNADVGLHLVAENLTLVQVAEGAGDQQALIDFDAGHITCRITPEDMRSLLVSAASQLLREYRVTIEDAATAFQAPRPRRLDMRVLITAKRRWLFARVEAEGTVVVDDDLRVRLCNLKMQGRGGWGRLVAALARPRLHRLMEQEFSLVSHSFAGVKPKDIAFAAGKDLEIRIDFESGSRTTTTPKPTTNLSVMTEKLVTASTEKANLPRRAGRLDIYVIDTGWNAAAKKILDDHFQLFEDFLSQHRLYVLTVEQSKETLKKTPRLVGEDPILVLVDSDARIENPRHGYGLRLCLGAMRKDCVAENLKMVLQIASDRTRSTGHIIRQVKKECHKQGLDGAIEIVGQMIRPE